MREFSQKRKKKRNVIYSYPLILIFIVVLILLAKANWNIYQKVKESKEIKNFQAEKMESLSERKESLEKEVERLNSPVGIEEELRNRYSVVKEGENLIVLIEDDNSNLDFDLEIETDQSLWKKIKSWFNK